MKKSISITIVGISCLFAFLLFSGVECNKNDPENCQDFYSKIITWRPTPVDVSDKPLDPSSAFMGMNGDSKYCLYWYPTLEIENVCLKEAIILTITFEIKEVSLDYIYDMGGFVELIYYDTEDYIQVENFTYNISGGIYTATGNLTIPGDAADNGLCDLSCVATINMHIQTDIETTNIVLNNIVKSITLNWAYTR